MTSFTKVSDIVDRSKVTIELEPGWKKRGYSMIGNKIVHSDRLSPAAKGLYWYLFSMCFRKDRCYTSYEGIAGGFGWVEGKKKKQLNRKTVHKYLRNLRDAGFVKVKRRGQGKPNTYVLKF